VLARARDAVVNENEPNCLWQSAGGESQIGTHLSTSMGSKVSKGRIVHVLGDWHSVNWCF